MVSVHFARPHRPAARDLQMMALCGYFAGQAVARCLGVAAGDGPGEVISRAVISALLDLEDPGGPSLADPSGPASRQDGAMAQPESEDDALSQFAGHVVNRLFAVGLSLESARSIAGPGPADDRLAAATGELDRLIAYIRTVTFGLAAGREPRPATRTRDRTALLRERMAHTARALQAAATDTAGILERQAGTVQPGRLDYPTEVKRWRSFADQAERMAKRWEQAP